MHVDVLGQAVIFGQGLLLGALLGLIYDGMRTLRRTKSSSTALMRLKFSVPAA